MSKKLKVGLIGGTGMVGQRLAVLLENHPWFEVTVIAASSNSAGLSYEEGVKKRWKMCSPIPENLKKLVIKDSSRIDEISKEVDFVFCAVSLNKKETKLLEEMYAMHEIPVISCNSANRNIDDVPMVIPEINADHIEIIKAQRKRLGTEKGFIAVKPNCSIQSYVPALSPLLDYKPNSILACTYQAISGSGKNFQDWPEMLDNVVPYIGGEEEKSENEPLKIWGRIEADKIVKVKKPLITTQCIRVPVTDGHLAAVFVNFDQKPSREEMLRRWENFKIPSSIKDLPSAPKKFLHYFEEPDRPQTRLDRNFENGMGITIGRLREDSIFDYKFVCLSHNTMRGAAGGALLIAELLKAEGYIY